MRSTISSLLVLLITLAGCAGSRESAGVPEPFEADDLRRHLSRFVVPAADSARVARRAEYASERFRAARLVPPVGSSFLLGPRYLNEDGGEELDRTRADALAYLPGRNPRYAPRLVLVSAPLGSPGAAAVVAAARALADTAAFAIVPERSVLFALWGERERRPAGLAGYLRTPLWSLEGLDRVLLVDPAPDRLAEQAAVLDARGIPYEVVTVSDVAVTSVSAEAAEARATLRTQRLTRALYDRLRAVTDSEFEPEPETAAVGEEG